MISEPPNQATSQFPFINTTTSHAKHELEDTSTVTGDLQHVQRPQHIPSTFHIKVDQTLQAEWRLDMDFSNIGLTSLWWPWRKWRPGKPRRQNYQPPKKSGNSISTCFTSFGGWYWPGTRLRRQWSPGQPWILVFGNFSLLTFFLPAVRFFPTGFNKAVNGHLLLFLTFHFHFILHGLYISALVLVWMGELSSVTWRSLQSYLCVFGEGSYMLAD